MRDFWRQRRWELLGTTLFWGFVAWPLWRPDRFTISFDTYSYSVPNQEVTRQALGDGFLPQWNDAIFGGIAHFAHPQTGLLNPLKLALMFFEPTRGVLLTSALHILVLAVGMVVLAHRLRLKPPAGLLAAVVVLGSGLTIAKSLRYEEVLVIAWVPWLLAAVDAVIDHEPRKARAVVGVAVTTWLLLVSGHPQIAYITMFLVVLWSISRACSRDSWRALLQVAGGLALGAALAAVQLLPTLLFQAGEAAKGSRAAGFVANPAYVVPWKLLPSSVFGNVGSDEVRFFSGSYDGLAFVGVAACALGLLGIVASRSKRRELIASLLLVAGALGAFSLAVGQSSPFFRAASKIVPFFDEARVPSRWMGVVTLLLAILAAQGFDLLIRGRIDRRTAALTAAIAAAGAVLIVAIPFSRPGHAIFWWILMAALAGAVIGARVIGPERIARASIGAVVVLVVVELGIMTFYVHDRHSTVPTSFGSGGPIVQRLEDDGGRVLAFAQERLGEPGYLVRGLRPNTNATFPVRALDGYDGGPQVQARWADAMEAFTTKRFTYDLTLRAQAKFPVDENVLARFGVRWVLLDRRLGPRDDVISWPGDPVVSDGALELLDNPAYEGEAFVYHATREVKKGRNGRTLRAMDADELEEVAFVEPGEVALRCREDCRRDRAALRRDRPGRMTVHVRGDGRALLVVAEQFDGGWSATIDGEGADVIPVDGSQIGVVVPAGRHTIELSYSARGLLPGFLVSVLAAALILVLIFRPSLLTRLCSSISRTTTPREQ